MMPFIYSIRESVAYNFSKIWSQFNMISFTSMVNIFVSFIYMYAVNILLTLAIPLTAKLPNTSRINV